VLDTSVFIPGRRDPDDLIKTLFSDDQFSIAIGNLLVMSDDEVNIGSVIAVHDTQRDTTPPQVLYANPPDGATGQSLTTRVGLSFSDTLDTRSLNAANWIVRPVGGEPLAGMWGVNMTIANFWPAEPLLPDTTYEVLLPAGGVADLVGNTLAADYVAVFSTGANIQAPPCKIDARPPALVGAAVPLSAVDAGPHRHLRLVLRWRRADHPLRHPSGHPRLRRARPPHRHAHRHPRGREPLVQRRPGRPPPAHRAPSPALEPGAPRRGPRPGAGQ
jgi:hypothetical protein